MHLQKKKIVVVVEGTRGDANFRVGLKISLNH